MSNPYRQILRGLFLAVFVFALFIMFQHQDSEESMVSTENEPQGFFINPYDTVSTEAKAIYVYDILNEKALYDINSEQQLPLASIAKLMTVLVANEELDSDKKITITNADISQEGDAGLLSGEIWKLKDLSSVALVASSNDAAYAISNTKNDFVSLMNEKARALGLSQTYFINSTGLDRSLNTSGTYGSARDVAILISHMYTKNPELLRTTQEEALRLSSINGSSVNVENTNRVIHGIPAILGSKTGYTDLAGGNLAILFDAGINRPIAVVVLGSSFEGRFDDVKNLAWASLKYLQKTE